MSFKNRIKKKKIDKFFFRKKVKLRNINKITIVTRFSSKLKDNFLNYLNSLKRFKVKYGFSRTKDVIYRPRKKISEFLIFNYLSIVECKIENVLYNSAIFSSRFLIRQLIAHGKIFVNRTKIKSKNIFLKKTSIVSFSKLVFPLLEHQIKESETKLIPNYFEFNSNIFVLIVLFNKLNVNSFFSLSRKLDSVDLIKFSQSFIKK